VLADDADVPALEDEMLLAMRVGNNDAVDEVVPLRTAYAHGLPVQYWDFGTASSSAEPLWLFRRAAADGTPEDFGHPDLIDSVPGDMGYSPIRALYQVLVTAAYDGEQITSVSALEDAIELGLLEEPTALGVAVNWPVVLAGTMVEVAPGDPPIETSKAFYRGRVAQQLKLGGMAEHVGTFPLERGGITTPDAYVLRRQNEPDALDEAVAQRDLNQDGDMQDSNVVFSLDAGETGYTSLWQQVDVVVPSDYAFGTSRGEGDLFVMEDAGVHAKEGAVIEYGPAPDTLLNRPIRYVAP
jgi:hypothetical protein